MLTTTYPLAEAGTGTVVLMLLLGLALGGAATWAYTWWQANRETGRQRAAAAKLKADAEQQAADILKAAEVTAQKKHIEALQRFETETAETRAELKAAERRLAKREDALDKKLEVLTTKERKIELAEQRLAEREREIEQKNAAADEALIQQRNELLRIARLTPEQAKQLCLQRIESEVEREAGELVDRIISHAEENAREKARYITITAIQRYAAEHTCETTVATVDVPSDDMKGRIIGREGRNIRAFEKSTGATVIVDDTPGIVSVSCMDPVRKEVARLSLDRLIRDGRIHPTRIEEIVAEVTKEVDQRIIEAGKAAAAEVNVQGIHKKIIETLGRLQYRTSYGQNVLRHSIEVAFLCGMMADELGLEGPLARRAPCCMILVRLSITSTRGPTREPVMSSRGASMNRRRCSMPSSGITVTWRPRTRIRRWWPRLTPSARRVPVAGANRWSVTSSACRTWKTSRPRSRASIWRTLSRPAAKCA